MLASRAVCRPDMSGQGRRVDAPLVALVMGFWLMTSYGFMYEVERGNIDLYALVLALLSVWLMIRWRGSAWLPATVLALAVGLKLYPAVLLVVLFWRYRWRALAPAVVTTLAVLLLLGPTQLRQSVVTLNAIQGNVRAEGWGRTPPRPWLTCCATTPTWAPSWIVYALLIVPLGLWASTILSLVRRGWNERGAVLAAAACVPLMAIVPAISHDYKLVLCVFPLAVLAAVVATMKREPAALWTILFGALAFAMIFLARSTSLVAPSLQGSKYALLVLLQVLLLVVVLMTDSADAVAGAVAGESGQSDARCDRAG